MTAWRNVRDWVMAQMALVESCDVQKDALHLPYYAQSSLYKTPWHTGADYSEYLPRFGGYDTADERLAALGLM